MDLITIAKKELIKMGLSPSFADQHAKELFIGFTRKVAEEYGKAKFREGAFAQKKLCADTRLIKKYSVNATNRLELMQAVKHEVENAPEPVYK